LRWFVVGFVAKTLDILSKLYFVSKIGIEAEANPFVKDMLWAFGPVVGLALDGIIAYPLFYVLYYYKHTTTLKIMTGIMCGVAINNCTLMVISLL